MNDIYINDFLLYLELDLNYSKNTINTYLNSLNHLKDSTNKDLLKLTSNDIEKFISKLEIDSRSIANYLSAYKTFYNYYIKLGKLNNNPIDSISSPKLAKHLPVYLTVDEVDKLLDIEIKDAFSARNKSILEVMYSSGLRISELINLEMANVDLDENLIRVMGKGSKERIVPIGDYANEALTNYINNYRPTINKKNSTYLFLNNLGNIVSRQYIFRIIKEECIKKGIKKNVSPHTLRHTYATHLLKNGAVLRIIQELLGHENLSTTEIYTHLDNETLHNDYNEFFPR